MMEKRTRLVLRVDKTQVKVELWRGETDMTEAVISDTRNLTQELLPVIETLLARADADTLSVTDISVTGDASDAYLARRMAETVAIVFPLAQFDK